MLHRMFDARVQLGFLPEGHGNQQPIRQQEEADQRHAATRKNFTFANALSCSWRAPRLRAGIGKTHAALPRFQSRCTLG
jgi:hypothetical protein